jgi:hypothetical protein
MRYVVTGKRMEERLNQYTYHRPSDDQVSRMQELRNKASALAATLDSLCPPSRELSIAHTNLEQMVMWANAAIARNEPLDNATSVSQQQ